MVIHMYYSPTRKPDLCVEYLKGTVSRNMNGILAELKSMFKGTVSQNIHGIVAELKSMFEMVQIFEEICKILFYNVQHITILGKYHVLRICN